MRQLLLLLLTVVPGVAGLAIFGHFAWKDWANLQIAYREYARVIANSSDISVLFVAEAQQNIHRINLFADGVWTLLSDILAAIGIHGLCISPKGARS